MLYALIVFVKCVFTNGNGSRCCDRVSHKETSQCNYIAMIVSDMMQFVVLFWGFLHYKTCQIWQSAVTE